MALGVLSGLRATGVREVLGKPSSILIFASYQRFGSGELVPTALADPLDEVGKTVVVNVALAVGRGVEVHPVFIDRNPPPLEARPSTHRFLRNTCEQCGARYGRSIAVEFKRYCTTTCESAAKGAVSSTSGR